MHCCASCGIAEVDEIKLKECDDCDLVKYCSGKCQEDHKSKHKEDCKKRAAELRDELLFKQHESSNFGDCPICYLPLSIKQSRQSLMTCCCKRICDGCNYANKMREIEGRLEEKCPFCRKTLPHKYEEQIERLMKRIEANDPAALREMGTLRYHERDYASSFEYFTRAAALGDVLGRHQLSVSYREGRGVDKDEKKFLHHTEQAAIGGSPHARHNLGCFEEENGRVDRAAKHYIIAAKLGYDESLEHVKDLYKRGLVSKEDFAAALRGHQAAIDATKSPQREAAEAAKISGFY